MGNECDEARRKKNENISRRVNIVSEGHVEFNTECGKTIAVLRCPNNVLACFSDHMPSSHLALALKQSIAAIAIVEMSQFGCSSDIVCSVVDRGVRKASSLSGDGCTDEMCCKRGSGCHGAENICEMSENARRRRVSGSQLRLVKDRAMEN